MKLMAVFFICATAICYGQSFQNLDSIKIGGGISVLYNKATTKILNKDTVQESNYHFTIVLQTKLDVNDTENYRLVFDEGPSADPHFIIYDKTMKTELLNTGGTNIIIPSNGFIYVSGHTNNMFNCRKKYKYKNGTIEGVQQPFSYVGLETVALKDIIIYSDILYKQEVARVPANSQVTVLLNSGVDYLIKTPFGLVGWIRIEEDAHWGGSTIKGLYYAGD